MKYSKFIFVFALLLSLSYADFLNDYLNDKVFGAKPGPCPDQARLCEGIIDPSKLNPVTANIVVCLLKDTCVVNGPFGICLYRLTLCAPIKNWFKSGTIKVWNLQCKNVGLNAVNIQTLSKSNTRVVAKATGDQIRLACTGNLRLEQVQLEYSWLGFRVTGNSLFSTSTAQTSFFDFTFQLSSPDYSTKVPNDLVIPLDTCFINIGAGFKIDLLNGNGNQYEQALLCINIFNIGCGISITFLNLEGLTNVLAAGVEASMGAIFCDLLSQGAKVQPTNPNSADGELNIKLDQFGAFIDRLSKGAPDNIAAIDSDPLQFQPLTYMGLNQAKLNQALDFSTDQAVEIFSVAMNGWLAREENGRLLINNVIDQLLGNTNGEFIIDLVQDEIVLDGILQANLADVYVKLEKMTFKGLNKVQKFKLFENHYEKGSVPSQRFKRTLAHELDMSEIEFLATIRTRFQRGKWVTASRCGNIIPCKPRSAEGFANEGHPDTCSCVSDRQEFVFDFGMKWSNAKFALSSFTAFNPSELSEVRLGQLFAGDFRSDPIEAAKNIGKCLSPGMYGAWVPSFAMSIGNINSPPFLNIPSQTGLATLVRNTITLIDNLFNSVFRLAAPGITQGTVRPKVNTFLQDDVVLPASLQNCKSYVPGLIPSDELYFKFDSGLLGNIYPIFNDVLGYFEEDTNTDMNDLIQTLLEYFSETYEDFPLEKFDAPGLTPAQNLQGNWKAKPAHSTIAFIPGFNNTPISEKFLNFTNYDIINLDSIYAVSAEYFGVTQNGIKIDLGFGRQDPGAFDAPLLLSFSLHLKVDDAETQHGSGVIMPIDEVVKFQLILDEMKLVMAMDNININRDLVYQLKLKQLNYAPCLFCTIDPGLIVSDLSDLVADSVFMKVDTQYEVTADSEVTDSIHPLALAFLELEKSTATGSSLKFKSMVNTILHNGFRNVLNQVESLDSTYTPNNCETADDPFGSFFKLFTGFQLPDTSGVIEECIAPPTEPVLTPSEAEAGVKGITPTTTYFDFTDSFIVDFFQGQFGTNLDDEDRNGVLNKIVFLLANRSGTPLADAFYLEDIPVGNGGQVETVVSFRLDTAGANFLFDLFDIEPLVYSDSTIIPGLYAELSNLTIRGINRFVSNTKILETKSRFVTGYSIGFSPKEPLIVELNGYIETDKSFIGDNTAGKVSDSFNILTSVQGFELDFDLLAAINTGIFGNMSLGHFFAVTAGDLDFVLSPYAMECVFSTFFEDGISIPRFYMNVTNLEGPTLKTSGLFFSKEVETVLDESLKLFTQFYIDAIPNAAYNCLRGRINDILKDRWLRSQSGACPFDISSNLNALPFEDQIFRFGTSKGLSRMQSFISSNFKANEYELWNDIMQTLTKDADGKLVLLFDDNPTGVEDVQLVYKGVDYGKMTLLVLDMTIAGLNTFNDLAVIEPVPYDNYTAVSGFNIEGPITFDFKLKLVAKDVFEGYTELENDLTLKLTFDQIDFALEVLMKINVTEALGIRFSSISSLNELPCLLIPFEALAPRDFNLTNANVHVVIGCYDKCQFPYFKQLEDGIKLDSDDDQRLSDLFNDGIAFLVQFIEGSGAQGLIDAQLALAEQSCAEILGLLTDFSDAEQKDDLDAAIFMGYAFLGFVVVGGIGTLALFPTHNKRKQKRIKEFMTARKTMEHDKELDMFKTKLKSLFQHPSVPVVAKFLIPFVCLMHIFGLVIAIVYSGAMNIILVFEVFGAKTNQIVLVPFTIVSTINDTWNSGSWYLALIIALASCAWPIIKNALLIGVWFLPTTLLGAKRRGKYLLLLDALGKWSFLDVFIVVMTLAALRTYLQLSTYARLQGIPDESFNVDVNVTPERGIILLLIIASSSLVVNHVISYYHERVMLADQNKEDKLRGVLTSTPKSAALKKTIGSHLFAAFDQNGRRKVVSKKGIVIINAVNVFSGIFVMVGIFVPLVTFEMRGLVGLLIETIDDAEVVKSYSVFDLAILVGESPKRSSTDVFAVTFFQILLIATSTIFPFLQVVAITLITSTKMSLRGMQVGLWFGYLVSFWAAIECFLVAIVLTLLEIDRITIYIVDFISDDFCSNVKAILQTILGEANGQCLKVEGSLETTAFLVFAGVFAQLIVSLITFELIEGVIEDRYFQAYNGARINVKPGKQSWLRKQVLRLMTKKMKMPSKKNKKGSVTDIGDTGSLFSGLESERGSIVSQGRTFQAENPAYEHMSQAASDNRNKGTSNFVEENVPVSPGNLEMFHTAVKPGPVEDVDV